MKEACDRGNSLKNKKDCKKGGGGRNRDFGAERYCEVKERIRPTVQKGKIGRSITEKALTPDQQKLSLFL